MLNVALTGNIAAGKSAVAALFGQWGATLIDADQLVREVQAPGTAVLAAIARRFGDHLLDSSGRLDRDALRALVLTDPAALADLNRLVHPAVWARRAALEAEARARGDRIVISEIPLLFEASDPKAFDVVILVDAPPEIRRARLLTARGLSAEEADRMLAAQAPSGPKRAGSTFVIDNDADHATLEARTRAVWNGLLRLT